jgi:hypothetical protein
VTFANAKSRTGTVTTCAARRLTGQPPTTRALVHAVVVVGDQGAGAVSVGAVGEGDALAVVRLREFGADPAPHPANAITIPAATPTRAPLFPRAAEGGPPRTATKEAPKPRMQRL